MGGYRSLIIEALLELYRRWRRPVSPAEVHRYLLSRGVRVSDRRIREVLYELARRGYLERIQAGNRVYYRPRDEELAERMAARRERSLLEFLGPPTTSEEVSTRADIKDLMEGAEEAVEAKLVREILRYFMLGDLLARKLRDAAGDIAQENPIELAIELLRFLCRSFYSSAKRSTQLFDRIAGLLRDLIEKWYVSVLGIPAYRVGLNDAVKLFEAVKRGELNENELCGNAPEEMLGSPVAAIAYQLADPSRGRSIILFSEERMRRILSLRIVDDRVAVRVRPIEERRLTYISGHDASYWPVRISPELLGLVAGYPADVYVLAGIIYSTWRYGRGPYTGVAVEVVPHPREYTELDPDELMDRGYLVAPFAGGEAFNERRGKRLAEAAMNILEYEMLQRELSTSARMPGIVLKGPSSPRRPSHYPRPVLHDGRLYPYEHKLDDYARGYGGAHPRLVRRSFAAFREIVRGVVGDPRGPVIVGVVKRPVSPSVYPLLVYALYRRGLIDEETMLKALDKWYLERFVVLEFLRGVYEAEGRPEGVTYRTLAIVRRLWSMDDKLVKAYSRRDYGARKVGDEFRQDFWEEQVVVTLDQLEAGKGLRGYLLYEGIEEAEEAAETLAYVLAHASVAMTYVLPPPGHVNLDALVSRVRAALPRYELLVAPPDPDDVDEGRVEEYRRYVAERVQWLALPCITIEGPEGKATLFCYEIAEIMDGEGVDMKFNTIVPMHVARADMYVKELDRVLRTQFAEVLRRAVLEAARRIHGVAEA